MVRIPLTSSASYRVKQIFHKSALRQNSIDKDLRGGSFSFLAQIHEIILLQLLSLNEVFLSCVERCHTGMSHRSFCGVLLIKGLQ